ncbi:MAG: hypothetical protein C4523_09525 [Myxococcales bacterium]|nr:MAG: hypothetical protein C4523_09525 [Myxococcales bacterium]
MGGDFDMALVAAVWEALANDPSPQLRRRLLCALSGPRALSAFPAQSSPQAPCATPWASPPDPAADALPLAPAEPAASEGE